MGSLQSLARPPLGLRGHFVLSHHLLLFLDQGNYLPQRGRQLQLAGVDQNCPMGIYKAESFSVATAVAAAALIEAAAAVAALVIASTAC